MGQFRFQLFALNMDLGYVLGLLDPDGSKTGAGFVCYV